MGISRGDSDSDGAGGAPFDPVAVIAAKRDGEALSASSITSFISHYAGGSISDAQAAALCMAVFHHGLNVDELSAWTDAMIATGETLSWGAGSPLVDKHSTGGVGDKTSLVIAPLIAAAGGRCPMLSGRGLGLTGGTLDKLDAIDGMRTNLTVAELRRALGSAGAFIAGTTAGIVPADAKLYALRDVTATVASLPLIASSIMSKKLAAGTDALVIDVKYGSGAFCATFDVALELASLMIGLGRRARLPVTTVLTDMSSPLGLTVGNACEVSEALDVLSGGGPAEVRDLSLLLAFEATRAADLRASTGEPVSLADLTALLDDGAALRAWEAMIRSQGGDPRADLPRAAATFNVRATDSGQVEQIDAGALGRASWLAGAGRTKAGESVDATAGVRIVAPIGSTVADGDVMAVVTGSDRSRVEQAGSLVRAGFRLGDGALRTPRPPHIVRGGVS